MAPYSADMRSIGRRNSERAGASPRGRSVLDLTDQRLDARQHLVDDDRIAVCVEMAGDIAVPQPVPAELV